MWERRTSAMEVLNFPVWAYFKKGGTLEILGDFEFEGAPINGKGYIYDGYVYQFDESINPSIGGIPKIYRDKDMNIKLLKGITGETMSVEELKENSMANIVATTKEDDNFIDEHAVAPIASSNSVYTPIIEEGDDFFKRIIKTVFLIKQVSTARYRRLLTTPYAFSNLFQGLNSATKVSVTTWQTWIELLGLDCTIIVKDSGTDKDAPIDGYIVYKSRSDTLEFIKKDNINDSKTEVIEEVKKFLD